MENYPILFQSSSSSSSSTLPPNSHPSLLNMVVISHAQQQDLVDHNNIHQFIQDDHRHHHLNPNSDYITAVENFHGNTSNNNNNSNNNNIPMVPAGVENEAGSNKIKGEKKSKKQPRYAFQTRSQVDILDDGYRWRKYGQKAVKNNKFPRSYYRCIHQGCNVKKQVQRLSKDEEIVVTTYEGIHSHPIQKSTDNFEHILSQMQIYTSG